MTFAYVSVEDAIERRGVRMVVVGNVPSPWGEAAKGILHIKGIDWPPCGSSMTAKPCSSGRASAAARC
jgi:hypothetical protein